VQKLDTHRESTRETSSEVKSASARESESESVERAERASEYKKGAHRHIERMGGREQKTWRKTEREGQRGMETGKKREIETVSMRQKDRERGRGGFVCLRDSARESRWQRETRRWTGRA